MKFAKALRVCCMLFLVASISFIATTATAQVPATSRVTPINWQLGNHVGETVILVSQVTAVNHLPEYSLIFLEKNFIVRCLPSGKSSLATAGNNIDSLVGKTVRITGKLYMSPTYGLQLDLTDASQLVISKGPASTTTPAAPRLRPIDWRMANYVNTTIIVESKVAAIRRVQGRSLILLEGSFPVVFDQSISSLSKAGIDVDSLAGKTVRITGKVAKDPTYGVQMDLTDASQLVIP